MKVKKQLNLHQDSVRTMVAIEEEKVGRRERKEEKEGEEEVGGEEIKENRGVVQ